MDKQEIIESLLIALVLGVGFGIVPVAVLVWFIENVVTPLGTIEQIASVSSSPNPWMWVLGLLAVFITMLITKVLVQTAREWFKDLIGF